MQNKPNHALRIMAFGDVVGRPGRAAFRLKSHELRSTYKVDLMIVNAENASGGVGLDASSAKEFKDAGADIITLGDHSWKFAEIRDYLQRNSSWCLRPANYPSGAPGSGMAIWQSPAGHKVAVMNIIGRVFLEIPLDCPFRTMQRLLADEQLRDCKIIVCDLHAEATSEKYAMARMVNGKVSLLYGTHTHVATADTQILSAGTAYQTDLGMCGPSEGVIGMDAEVALDRFITGLPSGYRVAKGPAQLNGIVCDVDPATGKALQVERVALHITEQQLL